MTARRKAKPGQQLVYYGKLDGEMDVIGAYGGEGANSRDSLLILSVLCNRRMELAVTAEEKKGGRQYCFAKSLIDELIARGYDINTLKFSIEKKKDEQDSDHN